MDKWRSLLLVWLLINWLAQHHSKYFRHLPKERPVVRLMTSNNFYSFFGSEQSFVQIMWHSFMYSNVYWNTYHVPTGHAYVNKLCQGVQSPQGTDNEVTTVLSIKYYGGGPWGPQEHKGGTSDLDWEVRKGFPEEARIKSSFVGQVGVSQMKKGEKRAFHAHSRHRPVKCAWGFQGTMGRYTYYWHSTRWLILCCKRQSCALQNVYQIVSLDSTHSMTLAPHSPKLWQGKMSPDIVGCSLGCKVTPSWETVSAKGMCEEVIGDEVGKPGRGPGHESHGRCDKKFGLYPEDHKKPLKDFEQEDNMLKCVLRLSLRQQCWV